MRHHAIGEYKYRLLIQRHVATPANDGSGALVDSWTDDGYCWTLYEQPQGGTNAIYGVEQASIDSTIRVRGGANLVVQDRLKDEVHGDVYLIRGVHRDERDQICACISITEAAAA